MLDVEGLEKTYGDGRPALRGCSLTIEGSRVVAVIGPSGAGKSSLIRCINRLVTPTGGRIRLDGTDITALGPREIAGMRRHIGMIFQEYNLVERLTVMENVLSGRLGFVPVWRALLRRFPQRDVDRAFDLLERVGLDGLENNRADALSGGQRQRVGIARALMQDPKLLLVDEPTSSLDPKTARTILSLITGLAHERGLPVLINIHDVELALLFAERIVGLADGRIVFDGAPESLDEAALTRIYGAADWHRTVRGAGEGGTAASDAASDDTPAAVPATAATARS